nr:14137_t:CDS:2 [Entrophospora candida]CAG8620937.1 4784_t:CDS:2 [Entrophospora candida]
MAIVSKLSSEGRDLLAVGKLFPPNNPKLDRLVTFLKTVPGTDKALMWKIVKRKKLELVKSINFDEKDANSKIRLRKDHERIVREVFTNIGYFPLTLHWSIPNSIFPEIGEGIFGTIAAYYELSGVWKSHS